MVPQARALPAKKQAPAGGSRADFSRNGQSSAILHQQAIDATWTCFCFAAGKGVSRLPRATDTQSANSPSLLDQNSGEPQREQKRRSTAGEERNAASRSAPRSMCRSATGTLP